MVGGRTPLQSAGLERQGSSKVMGERDMNQIGDHAVVFQPWETIEPEAQQQIGNAL